MRLALAAVTLVVAVGPGWAVEPLQLSVQKRPIGQGGDMWDVVLTNRQDRLNITHIELNRGACHARMDGRNGYPNPIRFGQQIVMRMFDCDPVEIRVIAQEGEVTLSLSE